ncbi:hypothetical protein [Pseudobutyrivibrio sp.]
MKKWELARYFMDAKKCVDTMLFFEENAEAVSMIDIREKVTETRRKFYINCCVVLDKSFPKDKKVICQDEIIDRIYYERDKNSAHKDEKYHAKQYETLEEIVIDMKTQLLAVKSLCADYLPEQMTVDFVAFDSGLYRLAKGITKEKEEEIFSRKFPLRNSLNISPEDTIVKKVFLDTEDLRDIPEERRSDYATLIRMGICMEESIQRLQDDCIKTNVLFDDTNMWVTTDLGKWKELRKAGLIDEFDIPVMPKSVAELNKFMELLDGIFPVQ